MESKIGINEKLYVYCHDCDKLLYKGPLADAVKIKCGHHTITCGKIEYINAVYPSVDTMGWAELQPKKGHLLYVRGNICFPQKLNDNELVVIPHCCNNKGVMGAGVAMSIKKKWPEGVAPYFKMQKSSDNGLKNWLGEVFFGLVEDGKVLIANMIGQDGTVSNTNPKPVKYWALLHAMQETLAYAGGCVMRGEKVVFHCPKFGSDLAGGKWELIEELIKEVWIDRGFDVLVYELEMDNTMWGIIEQD